MTHRFTAFPAVPRSFSFPAHFAVTLVLQKGSSEKMVRLRFATRFIISRDRDGAIRVPNMNHHIINSAVDTGMPIKCRPVLVPVRSMHAFHIIITV